MDENSLTESILRPSMGAEPYSGKPRVGVETLIEWLETEVPSLADITETYLTSHDRKPSLETSHAEFKEGLLIDMESQEIRDRNAAEVGYVIPSREAVEEIARHGPLLEVGSGTGYWAALASKAGADIVATDLQNGDVYPARCGVFHKVDRIDAEAAVAAHPDRNLLIIYPSLGMDWAERAARQLQPGRTLIYIGEFRGCCANGGFFDLLVRDFEEPLTLEVPRFWMFHEAMFVFKKRA